MKKKKQDQVFAYLEYLQEELKLKHWEIGLNFVRSLENEDKAIVERNPYAYHAVIDIPEAFADDSLDEQQNTLVHEMLHVLQNSSWPYIVQDESTTQFLRVEEERFIDSLTRILAPYLKKFPLDDDKSKP